MSTTPAAPTEDTATARFGRAAPARPLAVAAVASNDEPVPQHRSRRRVIAVVAGTAIAGAAAGVGGTVLLTPPAGTVVLVAAHDIAAGDAVNAGDVRTVRMTRAPAAALVSERGLTGWVARVPVLTGQVLTSATVVPAAQLPAPGEAVVGIAVGPGQGPAEPLVPGDHVSVVEVPRDTTFAAATPATLVDDTVVTAVRTTRDGAEVVSVRVPGSVTTRVAAAAAAGRTALVLLAAAGH